MSTPLIVIPTYNEFENITEMIPRLLDLPIGAHVLVVDDSSPDGTAGAVLAHRDTGRVHLLSREKKSGLGQAYVAGFRWALERPEYDPVVQMDADFPTTRTWSRNSLKNSVSTTSSLAPDTQTESMW